MWWQMEPIAGAFVNREDLRHQQSGTDKWCVMQIGNYVEIDPCSKSLGALS